MSRLIVWVATSDFGLCYASAVVGSMIVWMREITLAGKPPRLACSRTASAFGVE